MQRKLLLVDDEEIILITLAAILAQHEFEVSVAATVADALQKIVSEKFDVLLSDLNIGNPADGLTVVSAMRRTQPEAVTIILTGYPAFETALEAIRQQVDDYIVKPANVSLLVRTIENKLTTPLRQHRLPPPKRVAMLLDEHLERLEELWLSAIQNDPRISRLPLDKDQLSQRVHGIMKQVIQAAQSYAGEGPPKYPQHGDQENFESSTSDIVLAEFCTLRRVIAQVVQENLLAVNLSYVIPDLARVNEGLDELAQDAVAKCGTT
ncbi:response regulator [Alloacidobacterium sp.]|uniref:response regulator n=1 Tax=Alloacidobacterium sp. TaxID=2951999 RepID=UPI002D54E43A|nr:response regulator [Alloacidobacterium sp.]HYK36447.1 response regulator [Alloacidobacterium sp.]